MRERERAREKLEEMEKKERCSPTFPNNVMKKRTSTYSMKCVPCKMEKNIRIEKPLRFLRKARSNDTKRIIIDLPKSVLEKLNSQFVRH